MCFIKNKHMHTYTHMLTHKTKQKETSRGTGMPVLQLKGHLRPQKVHFVPC